jgi:hypothetical protein
MEQEVNPFIGTWEHEDGMRLVFTKEIVIDYNPDGSIFCKGLYTYDNKHITIDWENEADEQKIRADSFTPWHKFEDDKLIIGSNSFTKIL